jgi:glutathione S-transferase
MKLYFSPGACSLASHIALVEAGLAYDTEKTDLRKKVTASGADFLAINPKGYVPALALDGGVLLTEGPAIMQYIADQVPERKLAPAAGTLARYQLIEWLNFIATEVHKPFGALWNPAASVDAKESARQLLARRCTYLAQRLEGREFLLDDQFSVADGYLFTVLSWGRIVQVDIAPWPVLTAYLERIGARPAVQQAMREEGLLG